MSTDLSSAERPDLLTMAMIRKWYLPVGERTLHRMISTRRFPRADIANGGKLRFWRRETVEAWIVEQAGQTLESLQAMSTTTD